MNDRRFRIISGSNLKWVIRHRAWTWGYLVRYVRFIRLRLFGPRSVVCTGFVFLGKNVTFHTRRGYGRIVIEPWVHIGDNNRIRAHEGTVTVGEKTVFGQDNTINGYLDIRIGSECIISDSVYICDFDHRIDRVDTSIRHQGIVKSPVVIGNDVWIGTKVSILRGSRIGTGSVIGANSVVKGEIPHHAVAVGVPARVIRQRDTPTSDSVKVAEHQSYVQARTQEALNALEALREPPSDLRDG